MEPSNFSEPETSPTSIEELIRIALVGWKSILVGAVVGIAFGTIASRLIQPKYQTDALVQIDTQARRATGTLGDMAELFQSDSKAETEIELIQSRSVLEPVVKQMGLDNVGVSSGFARKLMGKSGRLDVGQLKMPFFVPGQKFWTLVATGDSTFVLLDTEKVVYLKGKVGTWISKANGRDTIGILVDTMVAEAGETFKIAKLNMDVAIDGLQSALKVAEKGRRTGVLQLTFSSNYPDKACSVLEAIANTYVKQNVEVRSVEARKTLDYLQHQLPLVKQSLDSLENTLNNYRYQKGTVDIGSEARVFLQARADIQQQLLSITQRRQDLLRLYREDHPSIAALDAQKSQLEKALAGSSNQVKELPLTQQQLEKLSRDVQVSSAMYSAILNNIQQLQVVQGGEVGNARLVDHAELPSQKSGPSKKVIMLAGLLFGVFAAYALLWVAHNIRSGFSIAEHLSFTRFPVLGQIPVSEKERRSFRKSGASTPPLALHAPDDLAIEAIRSLRTALDINISGTGGKIVAVSSLSIGDGKSFVGMNLAVLLAQSGKRVVFVDADMRLGRIHEAFKIPANPGLSEHLQTQNSNDPGVSTQVPGLFLLPRGAAPSNPGELLSSSKFGELIANLASNFDFVLIDTPPLLQVSDAFLAMRLAGMTILVLESGVHSAPKVKEALRRVGIAGIGNIAWVLNKCRPEYDRYDSYSLYGKQGKPV